MVKTSVTFLLQGVFLSNFIDDIKNDTTEDLYTTSINEIIKEKSKKYITYVDSNKSRIKLWCTMYDLLNKKFLPQVTNLPCWWCRETFKTPPLGVPINYISSKDTLKISQSEKSGAYEKSESDTPIFETEGIFCSFPCCKAYILENSPQIGCHVSGLLSLLYYMMYDEVVHIEAAPTWKILLKWNGHLTIEEYRSSFCLIDYIPTPNRKSSLSVKENEHSRSDKGQNDKGAVQKRKKPKPALAILGTYIEEMIK